jgi:hypothetical protein
MTAYITYTVPHYVRAEEDAVQYGDVVEVH